MREAQSPSVNIAINDEDCPELTIPTPIPAAAIKCNNRKQLLSVTLYENYTQLNQRKLKWKSVILIIILNILFITYFSFATKYFLSKDYNTLSFCDANQYGLLVLLFTITYLFIIYHYLLKPYVITKLRERFSLQIQVVYEFLSKTWFKWTIYSMVLLSIFVLVIIDAYKDFNRIISIVGFLITILGGFLFSKHTKNINWRPVILGIVAQFAIGFITIRWTPGRNVFTCAGDKISGFLNLTKNGATFAYGQNIINEQDFAFQGLSVIFFLSFLIRILYYYGILQKIVFKLGSILQSIMGTTICESVNCGANVFLGMVEAPIVLQPYLEYLTKSELHAVMTAGFATISIPLMGSYIWFGAKPSYLIIANLMSAPASLCFSKLFYPETETTTSIEEKLKLHKFDDSSVLDAASKGARSAIEIVLSIIAHVIAFITFTALLNLMINWLGVQIGYNDWSIRAALGYVFMPMAYTMGAPWPDCYQIGRLIGIKTAMNEFLAYQELGNPVSLLSSKRSEMLATFVICGVSCPSAVGSMISGMNTLVPNKRKIITDLMLRAFISGAVVCFMTACVAGALVSEHHLD